MSETNILKFHKEMIMANEIKYRKFKLKLNVDYSNFNPGTYERLDKVKKKGGIYSVNTQNHEKKNPAVNGDFQKQGKKNPAVNYGTCKLDEKLQNVNQVPKNKFNDVNVSKKDLGKSKFSRKLSRRTSDAGILKNGKGRKLKATADKLIKSKSYGYLSTLGTDDEAELTAVADYTNVKVGLPDKAKFGDYGESVYEELGKVERDDNEFIMVKWTDEPYASNREGKKKQVTIKEPDYDKMKEFRSNIQKGKHAVLVKKKSNLPVIEKLCDLEHRTLERQTQALKKVSNAHKHLNHVVHDKPGRSRQPTRRISDAGLIQPSQLQVALKKTPERLVKSKTCPDFSKAGLNQIGSETEITKPVNFMQELENKLKQRSEKNSIQSNNVSDSSAKPIVVGLGNSKSNASTKEINAQDNYRPPIKDPYRKRSGIPRPVFDINANGKPDTVNTGKTPVKTSVLEMPSDTSRVFEIIAYGKLDAVSLGKNQMKTTVAERPPVNSKSWAEFAKHWEQNRLGNSKEPAKEESVYDTLGKYDRRNLKDFDQNNNDSEQYKESDIVSEEVTDSTVVNNEILYNSRLMKKSNSDAGILKHETAEEKKPAKVKLIRAKTFASFDAHEKDWQKDKFNCLPRKHKETARHFVEHVYESLPEVVNDNLKKKEGQGRETRVRFYYPPDEIDEQPKQKVTNDFGSKHLENGKPHYSRLQTKRKSDAGILKNGRIELPCKGPDSLMKSKSFHSFAQFQSNTESSHTDSFKAGENTYDDLAKFRKDNLSHAKEFGSDGLSLKNGFINGQGSDAQKEMDNVYGNLLSVDLERLRQVLKLNANAVILPDKYLKSEEDNHSLDNGIISQLKETKGNPGLLGKILSECKEFLDQGGKYRLYTCVYVLKFCLS